MSSTIVFSEVGTNTFIVPDGVDCISVVCIGKYGSQSVDSLHVSPGQEIVYYIESSEITDDGTDVTYFGPYLCAHSSVLPTQTQSQSQSRIEITFV